MQYRAKRWVKKVEATQVLILAHSERKAQANGGAYLPLHRGQSQVCPLDERRTWRALKRGEQGSRQSNSVKSSQTRHARTHMRSVCGIIAHDHQIYAVKHKNVQ